MQVGLGELVVLHVWKVFSVGTNYKFQEISYKMSKIIYLYVSEFSPELRQKGNKLVKRQEIELYSGGALKIQVHKYQRNAKMRLGREKK